MTAQKIEESVQDVPISIVTRTGEELDVQAIGDMQALAQAAPGVVASSQTPTTGEVTLTIRGVGSSVLGLGTEATVGYYVDGVYMPRPQAATNPFLDLERVEILRGPQGTLWGRNSTAGAINVVTRAPRGEFHGRLFGAVSQLDASEPARARATACPDGGRSRRRSGDGCRPAARRSRTPRTTTSWAPGATTSTAPPGEAAAPSCPPSP